MLDCLDAAAVRRWCSGGLAALRRHQGEIDDLNVYPVPDRDTGTNLVLTLTSAQQALRSGMDPDPGRELTPHGYALRLMARGARLGALIGADLVTTCRDLVDRMLGGGGELVTLLLGAGAPDGLDEAVRAYLTGRWPFAEVHVHDGGQPGYPLLVGVE